MLGQYVTDHPLLGVEDALAAQTTTRSPSSRSRTTATW